MAGGRIDVEVGVDGRGFASKFRSTVEGGAKGAFSALAGIAKTTMVAAGATAGALFATSLAKGWGRLTAIEDAQAKLRGLGHSGESVSLIMENALASVTGTAYGIADAASVAATSVAAGIKPGQDLERTLKLVADAAYIGGSSMGEMGAIFNKVATSNKIQGEVIAQLHERNIPIVQLLAETLGKTTDEVIKLASAGEINFEQFQAAMEAGMGGAALKSAETTRGAIEQFGNALSRTGALMLTGVFPHIRDGFNAMTALANAGAPAFENFGLRAGVALTNFRNDATRAYQDFMTAYGGGGGSSIAATLGELAASAQEKLGPFGDALKDALGTKAQQAGQVLQQVVVPAVQGALDILSRLAGPMSTIADVAAGAFSAGLSAAGGVLEVFAANADMIGDRVEQVADILANIASAALPVFAAALQAGVGVLDGAITVLGILTSVIEPLAPALEHLGTAALIAFAAFKGYKIIEQAGAAFAAWGTSVGTKLASGLENAGTQAMVLADKAGASAGAVDQVGSVFSGAAEKSRGFGNAVAAVGRNLPLIGLGVAAATGVISLFVDAMNRSEQNINAMADSAGPMFDALAKGGQKAKDAAASLEEMGDKAAELQARGGFAAEIGDDMAAGLDKAAQAADEAAESMSGLEKAEAAVTKAQNDLQLALDTYGPGSAHAADASAKLAAAQDELAGKQKEVEDATKSATDALIEQANQILAASNAQIAMQQALLNLDKPMQDYIAARNAANGADLTGTEVAIKAEQQISNYVAAVEKKAVADAVQAGATDTATVSAQAQIDALQEMQTKYGALPPVMQTTLTSLQQNQAQAILTAGGFDLVTGSIVSVPSAKSVVISDNSPETKAKLEALGYTVKTLPDGNIEVTASTGSAISAALGAVAEINKKTATIKVYTQIVGSVGAMVGNAKGNILQFAKGGFHGLTPMRGGVASIVAPNTWRVIGDNMRVPEAYIPIDRQNARSRALLEETARRMGYAIQAFANGGITQQIPVTASSGPGGPSVFIGDLTIDGRVLRGAVRGEVKAGVDRYDTNQAQRARFGIGA